jgi:hypothetical protein
MDGKFPADSWWPEYTHSAYPADYQAKQTWLKLKGAYSNSLWFPIEESLFALATILVVFCIAMGAISFILFLIGRPPKGKGSKARNKPKGTDT